MKIVGNEVFLAFDAADGKLHAVDRNGVSVDLAQTVLDSLELELGGLFVAGTRTGPEDVEITDPDRGLVLTSPNGHRWRATIANNGNLIWTDLDA